MRLREGGDGREYGEHKEDRKEERKHSAEDLSHFYLYCQISLTTRITASLSEILFLGGGVRVIHRKRLRLDTRDLLEGLGLFTGKSPSPTRLTAGYVLACISVRNSPTLVRDRGKTQVFHVN